MTRHAVAFSNPSSSSSAATAVTPLLLSSDKRRRAHSTVFRTAAASSSASTVPSSSSSTDDILKDVEERLGVTLSEDPTVPPPHPAVIVISGPSGVGKDAVIRRLQELRPELHMVVTATSRAMRPGEVDGVDYFFVTTGEFEDMIEQGELIEHAVVYGEYKGIPKQQVREKLDMNTDVVLRLDVQGAATVRGLIPDAVFIFLVAESEACLARRLVVRMWKEEGGGCGRRGWK